MPSIYRRADAIDAFARHFFDVTPRVRMLCLASLVMAVAGSAFEGAWSALGFFYYHHPDIGGVPRWLPGIYLHVALLAGSLNSDA